MHQPHETLRDRTQLSQAHTQFNVLKNSFIPTGSWSGSIKPMPPWALAVVGDSRQFIQLFQRHENRKESLLPGFVTSGLTSFRIDYLLMYAEHSSPIHIKFVEIRDVRDLAQLFELAVCITAEAGLVS